MRRCYHHKFVYFSETCVQGSVHRYVQYMHICPINVETSVLDLVQTWTCLESSPTSSPHPSSACCLSIRKMIIMIMMVVMMMMLLLMMMTMRRRRMKANPPHKQARTLIHSLLLRNTNHSNHNINSFGSVRRERVHLCPCFMLESPMVH